MFPCCSLLELIPSEVFKDMLHLGGPDGSHKTMNQVDPVSIPFHSITVVLFLDRISTVCTILLDPCSPTRVHDFYLLCKMFDCKELAPQALATLQQQVLSCKTTLIEIERFLVSASGREDVVFAHMVIGGVSTEMMDSWKAMECGSGNFVDELSAQWSVAFLRALLRAANPKDLAVKFSLGLKVGVYIFSLPFSFSKYKLTRQPSKIYARYQLGAGTLRVDRDSTN